jgi:hypothetical protein
VVRRNVGRQCNLDDPLYPEPSGANRTMALHFVILRQLEITKKSKEWHSVANSSEFGSFQAIFDAANSTEV